MAKCCTIAVSRERFDLLAPILHDIQAVLDRTTMPEADHVEAYRLVREVRMLTLEASGDWKPADQREATRPAARDESNEDGGKT